MPDTLNLTLDAEELMLVLEMNVEIQQPCMTWGPPGIGKSEIYDQLSKKLGIQIKDVRAMLLNPVDVNGTPHRRYGHEAAMKLYRISEILGSETPDYGAVREIVTTSSPEERLTQITKMLTEDRRGQFKHWEQVVELVGDVTDEYFGQTIWSRPGILPKVGRGILLFDELVSASEDVQAALYQPFLDRRIGDHILGQGWVPMAAGNRLSDKGRVRPMPSPLSDRLQHYDLAVAWEPWKKWAGENGVHPLIIAYLETTMGRENPPIPGTNERGVGMLHRFNPLDRSFPTPRSWKKVSNSLYAMEDRGLDGTNIELVTIAGKVGREGAVELIDFSKVWREGLSMKAIITDPAGTVIPQKAAMKCAVTAALARIAARDSIENVWTYMRRMNEEYQVMFWKQATQMHDELKTHRLFTRFFEQHEEFMR